MKEVTTEELNNLKNQGTKILVDVYADWCGPCKQLTPRLEQLSTSHPQIVFVKMNVDNNMEFANELQIKGVPTVLVYNGKNLIDRKPGLHTNNIYEDMISKLR
jgi:thioredoxin